MTSLPRHLSCQLVRYCANWQFYWSVCAVLALTALFAVLDVQTISSTVSITANGTVQSHDALDPNLVHIVSDAMLASPYQTSIILIPIIVALIVAAGFRSGDERQLRLLYNRPYPFAVSDVLATVLYCIAVSLLSSLLNAAILVVMLNPALRPMFLTATVITTPLRVKAFAVVMGLGLMLTMVNAIGNFIAYGHGVSGRLMIRYMMLVVMNGVAVLSLSLLAGNVLLGLSIYFLVPILLKPFIVYLVPAVSDLFYSSASRSLADGALPLQNSLVSLVWLLVFLLAGYLSIVVRILEW